MRWLRVVNRRATMVALVVSLVVFAGLAVFLFQLGLSRADQLASVLGLFVGIISALVALVTITQVRATAPRRSPASPATARRQTTAWGPRPVGDDLLRLLTATRRAADTLSNPLLGERRTEVSAVYVQQRVEQPRRPRPRRRHLDLNQLFLPFDQQPRVIPVRRPLARAFDQHRHLLLEGGPGTGKTTTARQVCRQLADAWLDAAPAACDMTAQPLLPLLVSARALAEHLALRWPEAIALAARAELGATARFDVPPTLLEGPVEGVPWLVVVDGLDEVPGEERDALLTCLSAQAAASDETYRLLITTRPLAGHATSVLGSATVGHYTLVPFDAAALAEFARLWLINDEGTADESLVSGFLAEVAASGLEEVAAVPLMATIAVSVYEADRQHTLPRNRYDLYQRYISQLRQAGSRRRADARAELAAVLAPEPNAPAVAAGLYDHLDELTERLAVVRVSGRAPLLPAALEQLHRQLAAAIDPPPLDWGNRVVDALTTTGLISRRGVGLDFVHLSFAEHLAARVHARDLPGRFDAADAYWRDWIHRAAHDDPVAMRVLAAWTRRHPSDELMAWLLSGLIVHRVLAVRLVAEGTPATGRQVDICLDLLDEYSGTSVSRLERASLLRRFPADDRLLDWLRSRVDRTTDQLEQVNLARLLADRDPRERPAVTTRLTAILRNPAEISSLLAAAEALHHLSPDGGAAAVEAVERVMAGPTWSQADRVSAAIGLLSIDGSDRQRALTTIEAILRDDNAGLAARRTAAEALAEADGDRRSEILRQMTSVLRDPMTTADDAVSVSETIIAIAPDAAKEATDLLWAVLTDRLTEPHVLTEAVRVLASLGSGTHHRLSSELFRILERPESCGYQGSDLEMALAGLTDEYRSRAVDLLCARRHADWADRRTGPRSDWGSSRMDPETRELLVAALSSATDSCALRVERIGIFFDLAAMSPRYHNPAAQGLRELLNRPIHRGNLQTAVSCLGTVSPSDALPVAESLVQLLIDDDIDYRDPASVLLSIAWVVPDHDVAAVAYAIKVLRDPLETLGHKQGAAVRLMRDARYRAEAVQHLSTTLSDTQVSARIRLRIFASIRYEAAADPQLSQAFASVVIDPTIGTDLRAMLAGAWYRSAPKYRELAVSALRSVVEDRLTSTVTCSHAIQSLEGMKAANRDEVAAAARLVAEDIHLPIDVRTSAYLRLARLGGLAAEDAAATITTLLATGAGTLDERINAATEIATIVRRADRRSLTDALTRHGLRSGETDGHTPDLYTAERLIRLLGSPTPEAVEYLTWAVMAESADHTDLYTMAAQLAPAALPDVRTIENPKEASVSAVDQMLKHLRLLSRLGPDEQQAAAARLRQLLTRPDLRPGQFLEATRQLSALDIDDAAEAARLLIAAVRGKGDNLDSLAAAALLYRHFVSERPDAGAYLRAVLADPEEAMARRGTACRALIEDGGRQALQTAADHLRQFSKDCGLAVETRLTCGLRLIEICPGAVDEVRGTLLAMLDEVNRCPTGRRIRDQVSIAATLLTLNPADRIAIDHLCAIVSSPGPTRQVARDAAAALSNDVPLHRAALVTILQRRLSLRPAPADEVWIYGGLAAVDPHAVSSAAAGLEKIAAASSGPALPRIEAAAALLPLGTAEISAQRVLFDILTNTAAPGYLRVLAGRRLATRPGALARKLHDTLVNFTGRAADQADAALILMEYPGPPRARGASALRRILRSAGIPPHQRLTAAQALAAHDDPGGQTCAQQILIDLSTDDRIHPWLRYRAVAWLGRLEPGRTLATAARLRTTLTDPTAALDHRRWAAEALGDLDDKLRQEARDTLLRLIDAEADDRARRRIHRSAALVDGNGFRGFTPDA